MRLVLIIFLTLEIISCKKTPSAPQPKLQFYGNGHLYVLDATNLSGVWGNGPSIDKSFSFDQGVTTPIYSLFAIHNVDTLNIIRDLTLCKGPLIQGTYPTNRIYANIVFNGVRFGCYCGNTTNTNYTVDITSISNGFATGTFSGIFYPFTSGATPMFVIKDGTFSDIPIAQ